MHTVEGIFLWAGVLAYVTCFVAALLSSLFGKQRAEVVARWAFGIGLGLHLAAGITRWIVTGHGPVMYRYENSLAGSFVLGLIFAVLARQLPATRKALPVVVGVLLLLLGNGLTAPQSLIPLKPPFRSGWLVVHVTFAWLAFGSYLIASILAGLYLKARRKVGDLEQADPDTVRALALQDESCGKLIAFGFATDTIMIASGAIWAHGLWGRYWSWDPIETWSLISWLIYGANLHLRFTLGWSGKRAAWLALLSVLAVLATFFGLGVVSNVHTDLL